MDVFIGIDNVDFYFLVKDVCGRFGELIVRFIFLGWICIGCLGSVSSFKDVTENIGFAYIFLVDDRRFDCLVRKFWEVEEIVVVCVGDYNDMS